MKKLKGADGTGKILKISADTGKTLHRRKMLTKAVKKQITKHIRELNPMNFSVLSYRYISTCKWRRRSRALETIQFIDSCHLSFSSAKTLQHFKRTGLNQVYFTRSLIINTFFASLPGINFIRKKARVCGTVASLLYAVCLYRAYGHWTLSLCIYIINP